MSNFNDKDKEFIDAIWKKTRYLKHQRHKEENELEKLHRLKMRKLKNLLTFGTGLILISVPIIITKEFNETITAFLSLYILGFSLYYEHNFN
ncbi:hypothetical protein [Maledivibacter halophilus]|uniref:Uncharacterized protein n=1 Tax=Maledivibacter halophilus TaxID=36842 RepID=A0A1T5MJ58_9FIRM|nr:hypothetical protein [Maledivibacter halophilus]SKC88271.1 hypothetical protein SAMN02194393_04845 [Maledivibacter halophilus]